MYNVRYAHSINKRISIKRSRVRQISSIIITTIYFVLYNRNVYFSLFPDRKSLIIYYEQTAYYIHVRMPILRLLPSISTTIFTSSSSRRSAHATSKISTVFSAILRSHESLLRYRTKNFSCGTRRQEKREHQNLINLKCRH